LHRDRIEALVDEGVNQSEIAKILKVDKSTISREMKRKRENGVYDADMAQHKALVGRQNSKYQGMKIEKHQTLRDQIVSELKLFRSPEEIASSLKKEKINISVPSIYKWLYSPFGQQYCRYLCSKRYRKRKQKKNKTERMMIPNKISIHDKPKWKNGVEMEADTFLSPKKLHTTASGFLGSVLGVHLLVGTKLPNLKVNTMIEAVNRSTNGMDIDSMIMDNGIENRGHEQFRMPAYFCDPHAPWQKPHVECDIGLLRRWFLPKETDLRKVGEAELQTYINILNHKKRKSLGYKSAYEVALKRGILKSIPPRTLPAKLHFSI
jgi:IS30 family transposase